MNAVAEKPRARAAGNQSKATPAARRRLRRLWRPAAGLVCGDRHWRHRLLVVHRGPLHPEHRQRLCPGRHRGARPAHRGRRGGHQGGRQPARPCRRSADRARSGRLAGPPCPGHRHRRRGDRRGARRRSARSASSRPRSMPRRRPSSRRRPSRRGPGPMRRDRERWWRAAGRRARPTTRRSPMHARPMPPLVPAQAQKAAAEQQLAVLAGAGDPGPGAAAERRGRGASWPRTTSPTR